MNSFTMLATGESGTAKERRLVLAFYRCQSRAQGWRIIDELRQHDGIHRETANQHFVVYGDVYYLW